MSEVNDLMYEITHLNTEPAVFKVSVTATDHTSNYSATAEFRWGSQQAVNDVTAKGDTPEEALRSLRDELIEKYESTSSLRERCTKLESALKRLSDNGYLADLPTSIIEEVESALTR